MKIQVDDIILIKNACYGFGETLDLGPFLVRVLAFNSEEIHYERRLSPSSASRGTCRWSSVVAKIHERDLWLFEPRSEYV